MDWGEDSPPRATTTECPDDERCEERADGRAGPRPEGPVSDHQGRDRSGGPGGGREPVLHPGPRGGELRGRGRPLLRGASCHRVLVWVRRPAAPAHGDGPEG